MVVSKPTVPVSTVVVPTVEDESSEDGVVFVKTCDGLAITMRRIIMGILNVGKWCNELFILV